MLVELDTRIHRFVHRSAANRYLEEVLSSVAEQRLLLEAIRGGDGVRARKLAADHVRRFEREIRGIL